MLNCLKTHGGNESSSQIILQLQASEKQSQGQIDDLNNQRRRLHQELEFKDMKEKEIKQQLTEKDLQVKDLQTQMDRIQIKNEKLQEQLDQERKEHQQKLSQIVLEKDQAFCKSDLLNQKKLNELKMQLEQQRHEHQREVEKIQTEYEQALTQIKYYHEQEKNSLQTRVEKSTNDLSTIIHQLKHKESDQDVTHRIKRKREELEEEIQQLYNEVESIKRQHETVMIQTNKEKQVLESKAQKLQKQLEKIKNAPKPVMIDLSSKCEMSKQEVNLRSEVESLTKENEKLDEQLRKLRKEKLENQDYIEQVESKLRQIQREKNLNDHESQQFQDLKRQVNHEKRKNLEFMETITALRETIQSMQTEHSLKFLDKDTKLNKLYKDLRDTERKLLDIQSVFNTNNIVQHQRNLSPFMIGGDQISQIIQRRDESPISNFDPKHQLSKELSPSVVQKHHNHHNQSSIMCAPIQEGQMNMRNISQVDYAMLKICQRIADNALRMECSHCLQLMDTAEFYDHLNQEHPQLNHLAKVQQQQSLVSGNAYNTNKTITKRQTDDSALRSSSHLHNILETSPKVKQCPPISTANPQSKWVKNSRSFTCLLNEIEEEERPYQQKVISNCIVKTKSPLHRHPQKSRNISGHHETHQQQTLQLSTLAGNTLSSVLKSQKEQKKLNHNMSQSKLTITPHSAQVNTAQRTEIQNLKRENKKLTHKMKEQESKLNDVSRDCSMIKKQIQQKHNHNNSGTELTSEIRGLLQKLATYQESKDDLSHGNSGLFSSRQTKPISTESMVELKSISSQVNKKKKKKPAHKDQ